MRNPRYIVQKAPGVEGDPIPEDEPCLDRESEALFAIIYTLDATDAAWWRSRGYTVWP
jgi:hypothetical protein